MPKLPRIGAAGVTETSIVGTAEAGVVGTAETGAEGVAGIGTTGVAGAVIPTPITHSPQTISKIYMHIHIRKKTNCEMRKKKVKSFTSSTLSVAFFDCNGGPGRVGRSSGGGGGGVVIVFVVVIDICPRLDVELGWGLDSLLLFLLLILLGLGRRTLLALIFVFLLLLQAPERHEHVRAVYHHRLISPTPTSNHSGFPALLSRFRFTLSPVAKHCCRMLKMIMFIESLSLSFREKGQYRK